MCFFGGRHFGVLFVCTHRWILGRTGSSANGFLWQKFDEKMPTIFVYGSTQWPKIDHIVMYISPNQIVGQIEIYSELICVDRTPITRSIWSIRDKSRVLGHLSRQRRASYTSDTLWASGDNGAHTHTHTHTDIEMNICDDSCGDTRKPFIYLNPISPPLFGAPKPEH